MCSDAWIPRLVGEAVFGVPSLVHDAVRKLLIALPFLARCAERSLETGLMRRVELGEAVERNVRLATNRACVTHFFRATIDAPRFFGTVVIVAVSAEELPN